MSIKKNVGNRKVRRGAGERDAMRAEYDFSDGVRGKYASRYPNGGLVVTLDPDVASAYPTAAAANEALRSLMQATKSRRRGATTGVKK